MLRITHVEEIERLLLELPDLVRKQEQRDAFFPESAAAWLSRLEQTLVAKNLYQAATVAMLRSELVAAGQGQVPTNVAFKATASRRAIKSGVAAQAVQRASEVVSAIVQENRRRFAEGEEIAQQLVAVAVGRGIIVPPEPNMSPTEYFWDLRNRLIHGEMESVVLRLEALVGPNDILILLSRALALRGAILTQVPQTERDPAAASHRASSTTTAESVAVAVVQPNEG